MTNGRLAHGLALFGDNAYVNVDTMVTPYRNVRRGAKDDYNHFHSRISIERAFGMLVHRWAILRSPLSSTMGVEKQMVLVMALTSYTDLVYCCERYMHRESGNIIPISFLRPSLVRLATRMTSSSKVQL
jgi:hypothetical protein